MGFEVDLGIGMMKDFAKRRVSRVSLRISKSKLIPIHSDGIEEGY